MAIPMTAEQQVHQLRKWHVPFDETPGWRTHNRNTKGAWGPVYGIGLHHTGDDAPDSASAAMLSRGRSDLPGPLCGWGMSDVGRVVLIGCGRCNHFGLGSGRTLAHVINEDYGDVELKPGIDDTDGNVHFYGQETMYSGGHPMTLLAYRNTVLTFASVCDFHGWTAKSCIGHKEWTSKKVDPGNLSMVKFRKDVQAALNAGPGNWPTKPRPLEPGIVTVRSNLRVITSKQKSPILRKALLAADVQLAKFERR